MRKPQPSRTRYKRRPRRLFDDETPEDWQPEDPINGPGNEEADK